MLKALLYLIIPVCSALLIGSVVYKAVTQLGQHTKILNCSISEFQPDFTAEQREACRKLRENASN